MAFKTLSCFKVMHSNAVMHTQSFIICYFCSCTFHDSINLSDLVPLGPDQTSTSVKIERDVPASSSHDDAPSSESHTNMETCSTNCLIVLHISSETMSMDSPLVTSSSAGSLRGSGLSFQPRSFLQLQERAQLVACFAPCGRRTRMCCDRCFLNCKNW